MKKSTKTSNTYYQIILDASGSMNSCRKATIDSLNEQIAMVKALAEKNPEEQYHMGLVDFSDAHDINTIWKMRPIEMIRPVQIEDYVPRASTALWDAFSLTCLALQDQYQREIEHKDASVVVMVLTDGFENASLQFTARNVKMLIRGLENSGDWNFRFIGADFDANTIADNIGVSRDYAYSMSKMEMNKSADYMGYEMDAIMAKKMSKRR